MRGRKSLSSLSTLLKFIACSPALGVFPNGSVGKESACNGGDLSLIPGEGRSLGEGNGNPLQYSCPERPMGRGALQATVHVVARVGQDLATKSPLPCLLHEYLQLLCFFWD